MGSFRFTRTHPRPSPARKRLLFSLAILAILALVGSLALVVVLVLRNSRTDSPLRARKNIQALWERGAYQEIYDECSSRLLSRPLDPFYLSYGGFAAYYLGASQVSEQARGEYMQRAVALLKKSLVLPKTPYIPEIRYILGKSFFHLGYYYLDEATECLEAARAAGLNAEDVDEYLGMAYYHLGKTEQAIEAFGRALDRSPTDELYVTAALALRQRGDNAKAEEYLQEAIRMTSDVAVEQKARFLLAEGFIAEKRFVDAQEQLSTALAGDPESAEARYRLGLLYEAMGDNAKARSEWRKAIKADPMHQGARLKLNG
jgi:tetratricopeptide (TPR) repeat protein